MKSRICSVAVLLSVTLGAGVAPAAVVRSDSEWTSAVLATTPNSGPSNFPPTFIGQPYSQILLDVAKPEQRSFLFTVQASDPDPSDVVAILPPGGSYISPFFFFTSLEVW